MADRASGVGVPGMKERRCDLIIRSHLWPYGYEEYPLLRVWRRSVRPTVDVSPSLSNLVPCLSSRSVISLLFFACGLSLPSLPPRNINTAFKASCEFISSRCGLLVYGIILGQGVRSKRACPAGAGLWLCGPAAAVL